jgi:hypothetical protein
MPVPFFLDGENRLHSFFCRPFRTSFLDGIYNGFHPLLYSVALSGLGFEAPLKNLTHNNNGSVIKYLIADS